MSPYEQPRFVMVDAIREILGLKPLYRDLNSGLIDVQRFAYVMHAPWDGLDQNGNRLHGQPMRHA